MPRFIEIIPYLFRYLKSSHIKDEIDWASIMSEIELECESTDMVTDDALELRANEDYVSLFWSCKDNDVMKILDTLNELKHRGRDSFSAKSGMLKINAIEALSQINDVEDMIVFKCTDSDPGACIHHGLYYVTDSALDRLEVRSSIVEMSEFFAIKKVDRQSRQILKLDSGSRFEMVCESVSI
ncbi:hypothetical protein [Pseudomonas sp. Sample_24]|jgi:hypothetical protein|uniref:hypothetical protein n=1 Tax=Pseudomonas sp. Sample_24 TaxID=2448268 RepID=UPI001032B1B3|nr:hypothetical protein [Pseudomonas sp. Sample_24]